MSVLTPLSAVIDPLQRVALVVEQRSWGFPLFLSMILTALGSAAVASRLDMSKPVLSKLEQAGELTKASEREISEQVEQARRLAIVVGVAKGLFVVPLMVLGAACAAYLFLWLLGLKVAFAHAFTTMALAFVPLGISQGIYCVSALRQSVLTPKVAATLVPSSLGALMSGAREHHSSANRPPPERTSSEGAASAQASDRNSDFGDQGSAKTSSEQQGAQKQGPEQRRSTWKTTAKTSLFQLIDFFSLWSALVFALGIAAAVKRSRWAVASLSFALYFVVLAAVAIGVPGLMGGSGA
jgi:hypothetical protein